LPLDPASLITPVNSAAMAAEEALAKAAKRMASTASTAVRGGSGPRLGTAGMQSKAQRLAASLPGISVGTAPKTSPSSQWPLFVILDADCSKSTLEVCKLFVELRKVLCNMSLKHDLPIPLH
jgi:hypothetical protein